MCKKGKPTNTKDHHVLLFQMKIIIPITSADLFDEHVHQHHHVLALHGIPFLACTKRVSVTDCGRKLYE